jgi:hypothetical protein
VLGLNSVVVPVVIGLCLGLGPDMNPAFVEPEVSLVLGSEVYHLGDVETIGILFFLSRELSCRSNLLFFCGDLAFSLLNQNC